MIRLRTLARGTLAAAILALFGAAGPRAAAAPDEPADPPPPEAPAEDPDTEPETEPATEPGEPPAFVSLEVEVLDGETARPILGAEVFVKSEAADAAFEETRETNGRGAASFPEVPRGRVKIQATARGRATFGDRYELAEAVNRITIALAKHADEPDEPDEPKEPDDPEGPGSREQ